MWHRLLETLAHREAELICGLSGVFYGLLLVNPVYDSFGLDSGYREMGQLAPEWLWGVGIGVAGTLQLLAAFSGQRTFRALAALGGVLVWSALTGLFLWAAGPGAAIVGLFLVNALANLWFYVRLGTELRWTYPLRRIP